MFETAALFPGGQARQFSAVFAAPPGAEIKKGAAADPFSIACLAQPCRLRCK